MIKIVQGVYGFLDKNGIVRPKTKADEPFELAPEQEARLVRLGVAAYVGNTENEQEPEDTEEVDTENEQEPIGFDETPPSDFDDDAKIDEAEVVEEIVDIATLNVKKLRALGKEYGLTFKVGMTKDEMVTAITTAQAEVAEDEESEPAPTFDASEAVQ